MMTISFIAKHCLKNWDIRRILGKYMINQINLFLLQTTSIMTIKKKNNVHYSFLDI